MRHVIYHERQRVLTINIGIPTGHGVRWFVAAIFMGYIAFEEPHYASDIQRALEQRDEYVAEHLDAMRNREAA